METGDRKLNEVKKVTDMAYVPVIMADGSIGQIAKSDLASVVAERVGYVRKTVTLRAEESISINSPDVGVIMILGTGTTMTGSAVFGLGYGVAEESINVVSNTSGVVSLGTGSGLVVTKQQWGGSLITNKDTKTHDFMLITIR